jgi:hypothetical protein
MQYYFTYSTFGFLFTSENFIVFTTYFYRFTKPSRSFPFFPSTLFFCSVTSIEENSDSVHLVVLPRTYVFVAVSLDHRTLSIFFATFKISTVLSAIFKGKFSFTFKLIFNKLAFVCLF